MFQFISKIWIGIRTYFPDKEQSYSRIIHFARLSVLINAAIGLGKIIMGLYNRSFLFFIGGFYNIGLSVAKAVAVKGYCESKGKAFYPFTRQADKKQEYRYYQLVGLIILLASLAYMVGSFRVFVGERGNAHYSTVMVIEIGLITVFEIILSLKSIFARRREKEPILEAIKLTSFVSSLIGLVLMQSAILGHSGCEPNIYFNFVGIFLGSVSSCVGFYMIASAKKKIMNKIE